MEYRGYLIAKELVRKEIGDALYAMDMRCVKRIPPQIEGLEQAVQTLLLQGFNTPEINEVRAFVKDMFTLSYVHARRMFTRMAPELFLFALQALECFRETDAVSLLDWKKDNWGLEDQVDRVRDLEDGFTFNFRTNTLPRFAEVLGARWPEEDMFLWWVEEVQDGSAWRGFDAGRIEIKGGTPVSFVQYEAADKCNEVRDLIKARDQA